MDTKPWIIGNWKMNGSLSHAHAFAKGIEAFCSKKQFPVNIGLCPPFVYLMAFNPNIERFFLGGQDCACVSQGSYTGDISAHMLKDVGCSFTLIGHSERRLHYGEDAHLLQKKINQAEEAGLTVVLCVGETQQQRAQGVEEEVVAQQVQEALRLCKNPASLCIAYEPLWSIGSQQTPTYQDVQKMSFCIHRNINELFQSKESPTILYGGSVTSENVNLFLSIPEISGVLVGGASLTLASFFAIIEQI